MRTLVRFSLCILALSASCVATAGEPIPQDPQTYKEARELSKKSPGYKNLQLIGLAFHNYHDIFQRFPSAIVYASDGKTTHSWRVELLPLLKYLENRNGRNPFSASMSRDSFEQLIAECGYDVNQPWDSPENLKLLESMPEVFRHPLDAVESAESAYYAVVGPGTLFEDGQVASYDDIKGWPSTTLMVAESRSREPWTKPVDIAYSPTSTVPRFGGFSKGGYLTLCGSGLVTFVSDSVPPNELRAFIRRDDDRFTIPGLPYRWK